MFPPESCRSHAFDKFAGLSFDSGKPNAVFAGNLSAKSCVNFLKISKSGIVCGLRITNQTLEEASPV
jgi:hypothetical protein